MASCPFSPQEGTLSSKLQPDSSIGPVTGLTAILLCYSSASPLNKLCAHLAHAAISSFKSNVHAQNRDPTAEVSRSAIKHSLRLLCWQV